MTNDDALKVLLSKGADTFYHANTVATSRTFLENGALLSRGYVEKHDLPQTSQASDAVDKKYGIWNHIFLDAVDIHDRRRSQNHYGPVLFVFDAKSMLRDAKLEGKLRITRENPIHWKDGQSERDRYFDSVAEFDQAFWYGDFGKHFTFQKGRIPLDPYLECILLDDPQLSVGGKEPFETAKRALQEAAKRGGVEVEIKKRQCRAECKCVGNYKNGWNGHKQAFNA